MSRSIPACSFAQRWALWGNNQANVYVSVKWVKVVERIWGDSLPLHLLSCESWKKNQIEKKSKLCFTTCKSRLLSVCGWRASWIFHDGGAYYTETRTNQWTGFCTKGAFVMKELILFYLHVFIEIYSLIMTKLLTSMHPNIKGGCF